MIIESFNYLPLEAKNIRETVFVNEQGFNYEFDDIDDIATHLVLYTDDKAAATCRFFIDKVKDTYLIGRIAVLKTTEVLVLVHSCCKKLKISLPKKAVN